LGLAIAVDMLAYLGIRALAIRFEKAEMLCAPDDRWLAHPLSGAFHVRRFHLHFVESSHMRLNKIVNKLDAVNPAMAFWLTIEDPWRRVTDLGRSTD
jgi:hypothetical protein